MSLSTGQEQGELPVVTVDFAEILNLKLLKKFLRKKREEPKREHRSMCTITLTCTIETKEHTVLT